MWLRQATALALLTSAAVGMGWLLARQVRPRWPRFALGLLAALPLWWLMGVVNVVDKPLGWHLVVGIPLLWVYWVGLHGLLWAMLLAPAAALRRRPGVAARGLAGVALLGAGLLFAGWVYLFGVTALVSAASGTCLPPFRQAEYFGGDARGDARSGVEVECLSPM